MGVMSQGWISWRTVEHAAAAEGLSVLSLVVPVGFRSDPVGVSLLDEPNGRLQYETNEDLH